HRRPRRAGVRDRPEAGPPLPGGHRDVPARRPVRGGSVVCRRRPTVPGVRWVLLLAAQRRALRRPIRPRAASVVLPARPARRAAAVGAAAAGARAVAGPAAFPGGPPAGAGVRVGATFLLPRRVQTADLPAAAVRPAVPGAGVGA